MSRPRLAYLQRDRDRHGNTRGQVRIERKKRVRIRGDYGSKEFITAYRAAVYGTKPEKQKRPTKKDTLRWLIMEYRKSTDWLDYSAATKKQRDNIFYHILQKAGDKPYRDITKKVIIASRYERAKTPSQAGIFIKAMSGLFKWAVEAEYVTVDPCLGVKTPKCKNKDGFVAWTEDDIEKYQKKWPPGTKERVWLDVQLYTGLR